MASPIGAASGDLFTGPLRLPSAPLASLTTLARRFLRTPPLFRRRRSLARALAALASGGLLLGLVAAAAATAAAAAATTARALAAPARGPRRVGDRRRALLAHSLLAETLVLLVVLDARTVVLRHLVNLLR